MPFYETVFIARQDLSPTQVETLTDELAGILAENSGQVAKKEMWGLRALTFPIKKNRKGHYALINIDAPAEAVHELDRRMRLNEDIIRHMIVRVDALDPNESAILKMRDERGGRGDRPDRGDRGDRGGRGGPRRDGERRS
ncbi:30S ribosomal protein S6 [Roseospirillum parvum]|uniref:Small ribosomal subunit protein bS6 n=1 Tax=Roseospirillum parvum TaxID=83401 RepID=A0A1G8B0C3_9PROT|nr:30S ribosomal protein S6 [Roseospirillum parvum]SDH26628.1 small subunit ribosomal protein S6 [Roseospirillum parvum]